MATGGPSTRAPDHCRRSSWLGGQRARHLIRAHYQRSLVFARWVATCRGADNQRDARSRIPRGHHLCPGHLCPARRPPVTPSIRRTRGGAPARRRRGARPQEDPDGRGRHQRPPFHPASRGARSLRGWRDERTGPAPGRRLTSDRAERHRLRPAAQRARPIDPGPSDPGSVSQPQRRGWRHRAGHEGRFAADQGRSAGCHGRGLSGRHRSGRRAGCGRR